jgi:hypothetical protein
MYNQPLQSICSGEAGVETFFITVKRLDVRSPLLEILGKSASLGSRSCAESEFWENVKSR